MWPIILLVIFSVLATALLLRWIPIWPIAAVLAAPLAALIFVLVGHVFVGPDKFVLIAFLFGTAYMLPVTLATAFVIDVIRVARGRKSAL